MPIGTLMLIHTVTAITACQRLALRDILHRRAMSVANKA
jgi:hypothetical protein